MCGGEEKRKVIVSCANFAETDQQNTTDHGNKQASKEK